MNLNDQILYSMRHLQPEKEINALKNLTCAMQVGTTKMTMSFFLVIICF